MQILKDFTSLQDIPSVLISSNLNSIYGEITHIYTQFNFDAIFLFHFHNVSAVCIGSLVKSYSLFCNQHLVFSNKRDLRYLNLVSLCV